MSERTITIPYEEYQNLHRFRDMAEKHRDTVVVKKHCHEGYSSVEYWIVYSKDDYAKDLNNALQKEYLSTEEGDALKKQNAELQEEIDELKQEPPYKKMFNTLLFFNFLCCLAYVIGEYILN